MLLRSGVRFLLVGASLSLSMAVAAGTAADHSYVGSKKCKMCHIKEWNSWAETKMARSFEDLKPGQNGDAKQKAGLDPAKDYTHDAACLPCHTTGYGRSGGFVNMETTPDLAGVGCEMCHGAGGTYTQSQHMSLGNKEYKKADLVAVGLVGQLTEAQCQTCHNKKSPFVGDEYVFDFAKRKDEGTHAKYPLKYSH